MGLSRGGGAIAFQKVVTKVSDLPSPLDAEPGQRIIVRETEEVYGLNIETRMWEVIGTIKKVGGLRPEELKAHVGAADNPHKTSLQQVLDTGTEAKVTQAIVVRGKAVRDELRLLDKGALRYGPETGDSKGLLWLNVGAGKETILRAVNSDGDDMLVLSTDGIVSGGSATFASFKGLAEFEDEIVANEGVQSAAGFDLVLSGDKGVLLKVGGEKAALLTDKGLALKKGLGLAVHDLDLKGQVRGDLVPSEKKAALGAAQARWAAFLDGLDVDGQVVVRVGANAKKAPLQITGPVPGDGVIITAAGELGLGTDKPKAKLDVRGGLLVDDALLLSKDGVSCGDWATHYGAKLHIDYKGHTVLTGSPEGLTLASGAKVSGDLVVSGKFATGVVSGLADEEIRFHNNAATYKAKSHSFHGTMRVLGDLVELPDVLVDRGSIAAKGGVQAQTLHAFEDMTVGGTLFQDGKIVRTGEFEIDAKTLVAKNLRLTGGVIETNVLKIKGHGGSAEFNFGGPNCGLSFEAKHFEMDGINKLGVDDLSAGRLKIEGSASLCGGKANFTEKGLNLAGELSVGGLALKKVVEEVELDGLSAQTKFQIPAGVRVEAVLVRVSGLSGARFLQAGDNRDAARFLAPTTELKGGALLRGLDHWDRGQVVQKHESPVVITADAPATGKLLVTVHYVDPAAL